MKYTTTGLINAIKRNASIPSSQVKFTNEDFLAFLNEELELTIVGELLKLRQDYFVTTQDTTLVASQSNYSLPTSAVGWKLESIGYVDSDSNYTRLPLVARDQRDTFDGLTTSSVPKAVYIMGNQVYTIPDVGTSPVGSLRFEYVRIQNELVAVSDCGLISAVNDTGTVYEMTIDAVPVTDDGVDIISSTNPFDIIARNVTASVSGLVVSVTYGSDFSRAPVAGDYVCPTGKTPIANIPEDYHPVLAQSAAIRCLQSSNDIKGIQTAGTSLNNMLTRLRDRSSNRVNDAPKKIVGNNYVLNLMRTAH